MRYVAADVMATDVVTVPQDMTVEAFLGLLNQTRHSGFPVVDGDGRAVGVVSQSDVLRALAHAMGPGYLPVDFDDHRRRAAAKLLELGPMLQKATIPDQLLSREVREIMTPRVIACGADMPVEGICRAMNRGKVHRVVVVDGEGRCVGLVSSTDLVRLLGVMLEQESEPSAT